MWKFLSSLALILVITHPVYALSNTETTKYKNDFKKDMSSSCQTSIKKEIAKSKAPITSTQAKTYCDCAGTEAIKKITAKDLQLFVQNKYYGKQLNQNQTMYFYNLGYEAGESCRDKLF